MRIVMFSLAVAASLLAASTVAEAGRHSSAATCASFGVTAMRPNGDVVLFKRVVQIRTTGVACRTAHAIAKEVTTYLLLSKRVPARINGYRIVVGKQCRGCAPPVRTVSATGANGSFTFVIRG